MARAIDEAAASDQPVAVKGAAGRQRHAELFSPEATTRALLGIYGDVSGRAAREDQPAS
jgi:hypothetical protein